MYVKHVPLSNCRRPAKSNAEGHPTARKPGQELRPLQRVCGTWQGRFALAWNWRPSFEGRHSRGPLLQPDGPSGVLTASRAKLLERSRPRAAQHGRCQVLNCLGRQSRNKLPGFDSPKVSLPFRYCACRGWSANICRRVGRGFAVSRRRRISSAEPLVETEQLAFPLGQKKGRGS